MISSQCVLNFPCESIKSDTKIMPLLNHWDKKNSIFETIGLYYIELESFLFFFIMYICQTLFVMCQSVHTVFHTGVSLLSKILIQEIWI